MGNTVFIRLTYLGHQWHWPLTTAGTGSWVTRSVIMDGLGFGSYGT